MKLRTKTTIIVAATLAGLLLLVTVASRHILLDSLDRLEEQHAAEGVQRGLNILANALAALDATCEDWAHWDDTYRFAADGNQEFVRKNLSMDAFHALNVNLFLLLDRQGRIVHVHLVDHALSRELPTPPDIGNLAGPLRPLAETGDSGKSRTGIILLSVGHVLFAAQAVTDSERKHPVNGVLALGRILDKDEIGRLSRVSLEPLSFHPLGGAGLPPAVRSALPALRPGGNPVVHRLSDDLLAGYALVPDFRGRPSLILQVDLPRQIRALGIRSIRQITLLLILTGMVFALVTLVVLQKMVVSPLTSLHNGVARVRESGDLTLRVGLPGSDELSDLSRGMDGMLETLHNSLEEILRHRSHLEEMVEKRTASLQEVNTRLQGEMDNVVRAEAAIRTLESRYRRLFVQSKDVIIATSGDYLVDVNPAGLQLMGVSKETVRRGIPLASFFDPEDCRKIKEQVSLRGFVQDFETVLLLKGKAERMVLISATGNAEDGKPLTCMAIIRDVTQRRLVERQLAQVERLESIGNLAGGMAHDFNNILTAIGTHLSKVKGSLPPGDPLLANCQAMEKAAALGTELIAGLMAFTHGGPVSRSGVDLNELVGDVISIIRRTFSRTIEIETSLADDLPVIQGERGKIQQAIMNLCINARDAMPEGGTLTVATSLADIPPEQAGKDPQLREGRFVVLSVGDTGIGMSEETRQRIFEPFFTTKPAGKGTGLGLSVVYGVSRGHGGFVAVRSSPGQGSRFLLHFPAPSAERLPSPDA